MTPDGRYFVSRGRLWRRGDPNLPESERRAAIKALMRARLALRKAPLDSAGASAARAETDAAKRTLGEAGPVWWNDGTPDESGCAPASCRYAGWWRALSPEDLDRAADARAD